MCTSEQKIKVDFEKDLCNGFEYNPAINKALSNGTKFTRKLSINDSKHFYLACIRVNEEKHAELVLIEYSFVYEYQATLAGIKVKKVLSEEKVDDIFLMGKFIRLATSELILDMLDVINNPAKVLTDYVGIEFINH